MNIPCFILLTTISVPQTMQQGAPNMLVNVNSIVEVLTGPAMCKDARLVVTNEGNERGSWCVLETIPEIIKKLNSCN